MTTAVVDEPIAVEPRRIGHPQDSAYLLGLGADLKEPELVAEYFEYRDSTRRPGGLEVATLEMLNVHQKRRLAKKAKGK